MDLLSRIVQAHETRPLIEVKVPEWDTTLYFRPLTPIERANIRRGIDPKDEELLIVASLIEKALDADGNRVFDSKPATKTALLGKADMGLLISIMTRANGKPLTLEEAGNA